MKLAVHIPPDFEQRDDVRTLALVFRRDPVVAQFVQDVQAFASLRVLRLWLDWARVGAEWRPLLHARIEKRDWNSESLAHLITESCGWKAEPGVLMECLLVAGVLSVVARGDLDGLVLNDFAKFNEHLLPGYRSIQSRGGLAKEEKRRAAELQQLAAQQARVMEQKGLDLFGGEDGVTEEERQKCLAVVMGFDGVCGRVQRTSQEYVEDKALMRDALRVLRSCTWDDVVLVQRYVRGERENPSVVKETGAILRGFDDFLRKAK